MLGTSVVKVFLLHKTFVQKATTFYTNISAMDESTAVYCPLLLLQTQDGERKMLFPSQIIDWSYSHFVLLGGAGEEVA